MPTLKEFQPEGMAIANVNLEWMPIHQWKSSKLLTYKYGEFLLLGVLGWGWGLELKPDWKCQNVHLIIMVTTLML